MKNPQSFQNPGELLDALGRETVRLKLFGRCEQTPPKGKKTIEQHIWKGSLPASWYGVIKELSNERDFECPWSFFNFKSAEPEETAA